MITIHFRCGHAHPWQDGQKVVCATCGEQGVSRVQAPPPRITFAGASMVPRPTTKEKAHA